MSVHCTKVPKCCITLITDNCVGMTSRFQTVMVCGKENKLSVGSADMLSDRMKPSVYPGLNASASHTLLIHISARASGHSQVAQVSIGVVDEWLGGTEWAPSSQRDIWDMTGIQSEFDSSDKHGSG